MLKQSALIDLMFQALADPGRRSMMERLSREPATVSELAEALAMSLPLVGQHLRVLETAGLIRTSKSGRVRTCRIEPRALRMAEKWIGERLAWERRFERLGRELATQGLKEAAMHEKITTRTVTHGTFAVERTYPASLARTYAAWADPAIKARWFMGGTVAGVYAIDFRVGGTERNRVDVPDGPVVTYAAQFHDIVEGERIIFAYEISENDTRTSVSLTTVEFHPAGSGTRVVLTEQGAFLDGFDKPAEREAGNKVLLDFLGAELEGTS